MTPGRDDLWYLPLGGCGEIGMNMSLYGHNGRNGDLYMLAPQPGLRRRAVSVGRLELKR